MLWLLIFVNTLINSHLSCKRLQNLSLLEKCQGHSCLLVTDISLTKWHLATESRLWESSAFLTEDCKIAMPTSKSNQDKVSKFHISESSESCLKPTRMESQRQDLPCLTLLKRMKREFSICPRTLKFMRKSLKALLPPFMVLLILRKQLLVYFSVALPRGCLMEWDLEEISMFFF